MIGSSNIPNENQQNLLDKIKHLNKVFTYKHNIKTNKWHSVDFMNTPLTSIKDKLSFITYNIWFEPHNWDNRLKELLNLFEKYSPDFICLQEVTRQSLNYIMEQGFIQNNYYLSGNFNGSYDVLILSKLPVKFYVCNFASNMGRNLLIAEANFTTKDNNTETVLIATSHFESLNNQQLRKAQLKSSFEVLNRSKFAFLMGDFNFDSSWKNEEENIDKEYKDCWSLHKDASNLDDSEGYTMGAFKKFPRWRPDRILFKDSLKGFVMERFEIIGKEAISIDEKNNLRDVKTPSDHYGLYTVFSVCN